MRSGGLGLKDYLLEGGMNVSYWSIRKIEQKTYTLDIAGLRYVNSSNLDHDNNYWGFSLRCLVR